MAGVNDMIPTPDLAPVNHGVPFSAAAPIGTAAASPPTPLPEGVGGAWGGDSARLLEYREERQGQGLPHSLWEGGWGEAAALPTGFGGGGRAG